MVLEGKGTQIECEYEVTGFTHPELSAMTLKAWHLPEDIVRGVEFHHMPDEEEKILLEAPNGMLLSRIVFIADSVARDLGLHVAALEGPIEPSRDKALETLEALGFGGTSSTILETFEVEYEAIRAFF
jgi:hypothetical protein